jgi:hypothetical protein
MTLENTSRRCLRRDRHTASQEILVSFPSSIRTHCYFFNWALDEDGDTYLEVILDETWVYLNPHVTTW